MQKVLNIENIQLTNNKSGEGAFREITDTLVD